MQQQFSIGPLLTAPAPDYLSITFFQLGACLSFNSSLKLSFSLVVQLLTARDSNLDFNPAVF